MQSPKSNKLVVVLLSLALVGSGLALGGGAALAQESDEDPQQTTYLRVVHASPDAPPVDVTVDGETVLSDVPFGTVSDYLPLEAGTYNVSIAAAEDPETVVFEGNVTFDARNVTTLAATGEVGEDAATAFEPVGYEDDAFTPTENESAVRVVHLAPDAPTVDITAGDGDVVLADNVSFRNASDYVTVPAGEYTVEVRAATEDDDGPVVATVDVSLAEETAYSALAVGYLDPEDAPADTPFEVALTEDATTTVELPSETDNAEDEEDDGDDEEDQADEDTTDEE